MIRGVALTNCWTVLELLCVARVAMGLQFQAVPAVAPFLLADLRVDAAQVGGLVGLFLFPGALLALPGGLLGARLGDKAIVLAALGLLAVGGGWFAASTGFVGAGIGRFLGGTGGVWLNMQLAKVTTD